MTPSQNTSKTLLKRQESSPSNRQERLTACRYKESLSRRQARSPPRRHERSPPRRRERSPPRRYEKSPPRRYERSPIAVQSKLFLSKLSNSTRTNNTSTKERELKVIAKYLKKSSADLGRKPNLKLSGKEGTSKSPSKTLSFGLKLLADNEGSRKNLMPDPKNTESDSYVSSAISDDFKRKELNYEASSNSHLSQMEVDYIERSCVQKRFEHGDTAYKKAVHEPYASATESLKFKTNDSERRLSQSFPMSSSSSLYSSNRRVDDEETKPASSLDLDGTPLPSSFDTFDQQCYNEQVEFHHVASSKLLEKDYTYHSQLESKQKLKRYVDDFESVGVKTLRTDYAPPDVSYSWVGEYLDDEDENESSISANKYASNKCSAKVAPIIETAPRYRYERYSPEADYAIHSSNRHDHFQIENKDELHYHKPSVTLMLDHKEERSDNLQREKTLFQARSANRSSDNLFGYPAKMGISKRSTQSSYEQSDEKLQYEPRNTGDSDYKKVMLDDEEESWSNVDCRSEQFSRYSAKQLIYAAVDESHVSNRFHPKQLEDPNHDIHQNKTDIFAEKLSKLKQSDSKIDYNFSVIIEKEKVVGDGKYCQKTPRSQLFERRKFADRSARQSIDDYGYRTKTCSSRFQDLPDNTVSYSKTNTQRQFQDNEMKSKYSFYDSDSSRRFAERQQEYPRPLETRNNDDMDIDSDSDGVVILQGSGLAPSKVKEKAAASSIRSFEGAWRAATNTSIKVPGSAPFFPSQAPAMPYVLQSEEGDKHISVMRNKPNEPQPDDKREVRYAEPNQPSSNHW